MSLTEIREQIAGLTAEERLDVAALIAHLNRAEDPEFQHALDQRAANMDADKKSTLDDLERRPWCESIPVTGQLQGKFKAAFGRQGSRQRE